MAYKFNANLNRGSKIAPYTLYKAASFEANEPIGLRAAETNN